MQPAIRNTLRWTERWSRVLSETSENGWTSRLRMLMNQLNARTCEPSIKVPKNLWSFKNRFRTNGMLLSKGKEKLARGAKHFTAILNRPEPASPAQTEDPPHMLPIITDDFSVDETRRAIKSPKNKSAGFNTITAEMPIAPGDCVITWMCSLFNQIWNSGFVPEDWKNGEVVYIPKKRNSAECDNWKGVTLLSNPGKVYCQIILNEIYDTETMSYRKNKQLSSLNAPVQKQIFTLRKITEKCEEYQVPLAINFIDFTEAFDSIHTITLEDP